MDMFFSREAAGQCSLLPESVEMFMRVSLIGFWHSLKSRYQTEVENFILFGFFFPKLYLHQSLNLSEFNDHILIFLYQKELEPRDTRAAVSLFFSSGNKVWKSALDSGKLGRMCMLTSPAASSQQPELRRAKRAESHCTWQIHPRIIPEGQLLSPF